MRTIPELFSSESIVSYKQKENDTDIGLRRIVTYWMAGVILESGTQPFDIILFNRSVYLLDNLHESQSLDKKTLQCQAAACMVAAGFKPPDGSNVYAWMVMVSDNSPDVQVEQMKKIVDYVNTLSISEERIVFPSDFLIGMNGMQRMQDKEYWIAIYHCIMAQCDWKLLTTNLPSTIAASAMQMAYMHKLRKARYWSNSCFHDKVSPVCVRRFEFIQEYYKHDLKMLDTGVFFNLMRLPEQNIGVPPIELLCIAAGTGLTHICKFLVDKGVDVNNVGKDKWTPLQLAAFFGFVDTVDILLPHSSSINVFTAQKLAVMNNKQLIIAVMESRTPKFLEPNLTTSMNIFKTSEIIASNVLPLSVADVDDLNKLLLHGDITKCVYNPYEINPKNGEVPRIYIKDMFKNIEFNPFTREPIRKIEFITVPVPSILNKLNNVFEMLQNATGGSRKKRVVRKTQKCKKKTTK